MIEEGQVWEYRGDSMSGESYIIIRKIERLEGGGIVHISVKDLRLENELWDIDHIPIDESMLVDSLKVLHDKISTDEIDDDFECGYAEWKKANGGVWNIPLAEVVRSTIDTLNEN